MKRDERIYGCGFCSFFSSTKHPDILKLKLEWIKFGEEGKEGKTFVFKSKKRSFAQRKGEYVFWVERAKTGRRGVCEACRDNLPSAHAGFLAGRL